MVDIRLVLVLAFAASAAAKPMFSVIGPNVFRLNHPSKVLVSIYDTNNQQVSVWLQYGNTKFSRQDVIVANEESPEKVTMKVTEKDIFGDTKEDGKPKYVKLMVSCMGETKESEVLISYQSGFMIIQLDKPLYSPGQIVYYRVLDLDENLKRNKDAQLAIDIIDATNRTVRRTKPVAKGGKIYSDKYEIPDYADLGLWTVRAFYMGNYSTEARITFSVEEYVLPTFGVDVKISDRFISPGTEEFTVEVSAKYVYGKPVDGNVGLQLYLRKDADGFREYITDTDRRILNDGLRTFTLVTANFLKWLPADGLPADVQVGTIPPPGYSLEVIANVFEYVTANEEEGSNDVIFTKDPYKFSFKKSLDSYSPDFLYTLQVEVLYANGDVVQNGDVDLTMIEKNTNKKEEDTVAISKGRVSKPFETPDVNQELEFQATFEAVKSQIFTVKPYSGSNQLRMELVEHKKKKELRINSDVGDSNAYSQLTVMIIARGNIEWLKQKELKRSMTETIDDNLLSLIAPSARAVAFYVVKATGEVIASSIRLETPPKCRGNGLRLKGKATQYEPGLTADLEIDGAPLMHVGLNAMDSALLLLNDDNIMKTNTMFSLLAKHDLGCGPGGGVNSEDVFKRAGVTVLTNANVDSVKRVSMSCDGNTRKKRSASSVCDNFNLDENCCMQGAFYATTILEEKRVAEKHKPDLHIDVLSKCSAKAKQLLKNDNFTSVCINAFLKNCWEVIYEYQEEDSGVGGKSDDGESEFERDIRVLNHGNAIGKIRANFRDSWLFDNVHLSKHGKAKKTLKLPDSITTWHIQGIDNTRGSASCVIWNTQPTRTDTRHQITHCGYSESTGVCIAEPLDIVSFRKFFIQLELPYSSVRLENINVKMSVFNYYPGPLQVNAYLDGQKNLCSNAKIGEKSPRQNATVLGNNATSFNYLVLPTVAGDHDIVVTAFGTSDTGVTQTDAVKKTLLVVNEGKPVSKTITVCLDPISEMKDCENSKEVFEVARDKGTKIIRMTLRVPKNAVPKTGHAVGYIKSNLMTDVAESAIQGTDSLINMPWGCGEQTMIGLAPAVYSMYYLKQTQQMTPDIENKGNDVVRKGVERELAYRKDDFSYAAWKTRPTSVWLTSFVMKVFCQADKAVDNSVNEDLDIVPTLNYLLTQQTNGIFDEQLAVSHREMMGQVSENNPSLTAFVVTSFMECNARTAEMNDTMMEAVKFLEGVPESDYENNPYLLAITTYALGMAKSNKMWHFMDMLESQAQTDGKKVYWGVPGGHPASANAVETTSYALLAYLTFNKVEESASIVRWLSQQRQAKGSFRSTQDTVVALQALSEYTVRTYKKDVELKVHFIKPIDKKLNVTSENAKVVKVIEDLHSGDGDTNVTVKVEGKGNAILSIDLTYNLPAENEKCPFNVDEITIDDIKDGADDITDEVAEMRNCDVCGVCDDKEIDRQHMDYANMAGMEIEPKVGFKIGDRRRRASGQGPNAKKHCVRFAVSSKIESDMAIVSFGLQTGLHVIKDDLKKLKDVENTTLARYETPATGKNYVIFYLDKIGPEPMVFTFRVTDDFTGNVDTRQMAKVDVYDYYDPDRTCTRFYGIDSPQGKPTKYECSGPSNTNCQCLQNICAENYMNKFMNAKRTKVKGRPARMLIRHICSTRKAQLAVLVKIMSKDNDPHRQLVMYTGEVKKVIHTGKEKLNVGDEMTFRKNVFCEQPKLQENKQYYIVTKDGISTGNNQYEYELMEDAIVLKKPWKGPLRKAMNNFEKGLRKGCPS